MRTLRLGTLAVIAAALVVTTPSASLAVTISLNSYLTNPSFENSASGCPTGWTCSNLAVDSSITALMYPAPNGLPSGQVVPSGSNAVFAPVAGANGSLSQTIPSSTLSFLANTSYSLDFWLGNPAAGAGFAKYPNRIDISLATNHPLYSALLCDSGRTATITASGGGTRSWTSAPDNSGVCGFSLEGSNDPPYDIDQPLDGTWLPLKLTFNNNNFNWGSDIILTFTVFGTAAENGARLNLDLLGPTTITAVSTPEPATLLMLGTGLAGIGARFRRRRAR